MKISNRALKTWSIVIIITSISVFLAGCNKTRPLPAKAVNPTITALSVTSGPYTTMVTITGTGFSTTADDNKVFFNGVPAIVYTATSTSIVASVPLAAGNGPVTMMINNATATGPSFAYQQTEVVTTFAGDNELSGFADGTGVKAKFRRPDGLAIDSNDNIFVADKDNNAIRKITPSGVVTTIAGTGTAGFADGTAKTASFNGPTAVAVDNSGNLFVADAGNNAVRKITPEGIVSTIADNHASLFSNLTGIIVDKDENIYVSDRNKDQIILIAAQGYIKTYSAGNPFEANETLTSPAGLVMDNNGVIYVTGYSRVIKIYPGGGAAYFSGYSTSATKDGDNPGYDDPWGIALDKKGNFIVTDNFAIRQVNQKGAAITIAGSSAGVTDGPVATATFLHADGVVVDKKSNIFIADEAGTIREISFQ